MFTSVLISPVRTELVPHGAAGPSRVPVAPSGDGFGGALARASQGQAEPLAKGSGGVTAGSGRSTRRRRKPGSSGAAGTAPVPLAPLVAAYAGELLPPATTVAGTAPRAEYGRPSPIPLRPDAVLMSPQPRPASSPALAAPPGSPTPAVRPGAAFAGTPPPAGAGVERGARHGVQGGMPAAGGGAATPLRAASAAAPSRAGQHPSETPSPLSANLQSIRSSVPPPEAPPAHGPQMDMVAVVSLGEPALPAPAPAGTAARGQASPGVAGRRAPGTPRGLARARGIGGAPATIGGGSAANPGGTPSAQPTAVWVSLDAGTPRTGADPAGGAAPRPPRAPAPMPAAPMHALQIQLNPPGLGPLDVRVQVRGSLVHTDWTVAHPLVQGALLADGGGLGQALGRHGLSLAGMQVGLRGDGGAAFAGQGEGGGGTFPQPHHVSGTRAGGTPAAPTARRSGGGSRIDLVG